MLAPTSRLGIDTVGALSLSARMEAIPLEIMFALAIVLVLVMGAFAIAFLLRRSSGLIASTRDRQSAALAIYEKTVALQQESINVTRESMAVQRETNRLLSELLARPNGRAGTGDDLPTQKS